MTSPSVSLATRQGYPPISVPLSTRDVTMLAAGAGALSNVLTAAFVVVCVAAAAVHRRRRLGRR
ncbi:MAG: hypothetical protein JWM34_2499 [Ilumatobacteraceae bacterium]|nr:hypothetical protein [Ilumatobacteraceae bacterium]